MNYFSHHIGSLLFEDRIDSRGEFSCHRYDRFPRRPIARMALIDRAVAFYDALETNDSAVNVLGDETLRTIAREVTDAVRKNVTIDWTMRENVRAQLRVIIKRILRKYGYPPDKQEKATQTVLEQVELLGWEVAA